ncbi:unnamed protein product [Calypogeia fissa]
MLFKQSHFVLVHGAGHGAWCWVKMEASLKKAGHRVTAVDLASAGNDTQSADDITSLKEYNQPLEDLLASFPEDEKVILVGHSLGGSNLTLVSELFPTKISAAVYLAALMPGYGVDLNELQATNPDFLAPDDAPDKMYIFYSKVEGGPITSMAFPVERLKRDLYNKCSKEDIDSAVPLLKKFPNVELLFPAISPLTKEKYGTVPRIQVTGMQDYALTPESQRIMAALNPPHEIHEIEGDHSLMFSAVEDLTKILLETAAKYDSKKGNARQCQPE